MIISYRQVWRRSGDGAVMVDTFLAAHKGQMPDEAWRKRRDEWTYEVSQRGWEEGFRKDADTADSEECLYIAEDDSGEAIGVAKGELAEENAAGTIGEVVVLYVRLDRQGQGVGRRLVAAVAAHLARQGVTTLHIAVLTANAPARRFYESLGGQIVSERLFDEEGFLLPEVVYGWSDINIIAPS